MNSLVARVLESGHKDLITDAAFNHTGDRLATCSCDHAIKIWDREENSGEWRLRSEWKAHSGAVWKISWAPVEYGQILVTCSFDRTASVWREVLTDTSALDGYSSTWLRQAPLIDSRASVIDVEFAPRSMGLQLATLSIDGVVRIYEAGDPMNSVSWSLDHELNTKGVGSCLSWSTVPSLLPQLLAVGFTDFASSAPPAPPIGSVSGTSLIDRSHNVRVVLYEYSGSLRKWNKVHSITCVQEKVCDVAFAPNLGRSYYLLAVASTYLHILAIQPSKSTESAQTHSVFEVREVAVLKNHKSFVTRLGWNITGTILASSSDDGCVRLWKANYMQEWHCVNILTPSGKIVDNTALITCGHETSDADNMTSAPQTQQESQQRATIMSASTESQSKHEAAIGSDSQPSRNRGVACSQNPPITVSNLMYRLHSNKEPTLATTVRH